MIGYYEFRDCPTCGVTISFLAPAGRKYCSKKCSGVAAAKRRWQQVLDARAERERARA